MPTVNIYYKELNKKELIQKLTDKLKIYLVELLSCADIKLNSNEISIRLLKVDGDMIGEVEVEILAHAFPERIKRQDEICLKVMDYIKNQDYQIGEVRVWLQLCELGHSWK